MRTRTVFWVGVAVLAVAVLSLGTMGLGWVAFARGPWNVSAQAAVDDAGWNNGFGCGGSGQGAWRGFGPGWMMNGRTDTGCGMGDSSGPTGTGSGTCPYGTDNTATEGATRQALTIQEAQTAVERYLSQRGYSELRIDELMEFENNFYAIVQETATGTGAMELLIDRWSGLVGPEMGPNMMWNAKYGMMGGRGMMGANSTGEMRIGPDEAVAIAQAWLDANQPGTKTEEHADAFYGYYTIHTLKDGLISGMLSVHGGTGQVWYHTWHGSFLQMAAGPE